MIRSGRHLARRSAVQALYQWSMTGQSPSEIRETFIYHAGLAGKYRDYFDQLIENIPVYVQAIDGRIEPHLNRREDQVDLIAQAILRLGTYELQYDKTVPARVVIDEAVELAKVFCAENSFRFVNGVLDKVAADVRPDECKSESVEPG